MREQQRLFLVQARSNFVVFNVFRSQVDVPHCHGLHYLQMATEMLGKALAWKDGPPRRSHRAFVPFLRTLATNRKAQEQLVYRRKNNSWRNLIRKSVPLADRVERLAPALCGDGPNPEYPWPAENPVYSPVEHEFEVWQQLEDSDGRQFVKFVSDLFDVAETFL